MAKKAKKKEFLTHTVVGRFDSKEATGLMGELGPQLRGEKVKGAILDFSEATHITSGGILGLKQLGEQMGSDGKKLVVSEMRSEMYKALKVAGISNGLVFSHRSISPPSP